VAAPVELLRSVPLFAELGRREVSSIARSFKERTYESGETVASEGSGGAGFFVIEAGTALVTVRGEERRTLKAGDYFGEIALIAETDRTATITATSFLQCYAMTFWEFRPLVEGNASIAWQMLQAMAKMLRVAEQRAG
jgi:CRP-like cAMP-binding protein